MSQNNNDTSYEKMLIQRLTNKLGQKETLIEELSMQNEILRNELNKKNEECKNCKCKEDKK